MIDHWEVDGDLVSLEEELGEGAFGKVYKGALKEHIPLSHKRLSLKTPTNASRTATIKGNEMLTVAVKMLHSKYHKCIICSFFFSYNILLDHRLLHVYLYIILFLSSDRR